ncbi:MAG TPA: hypothetical protein VHP58_05430 [Alphaproteobacteria bacterium]|nr:hypothetical protein [Alphaproteobacteria bacterium]
MNFLITGIVICEAAPATDVLAAVETFFRQHGITAVNLKNHAETSQSRVMFDVALIANPALMDELKTAITAVYPRYKNGKPREHISIAMITSDAARIPGIMDYWLSGKAGQKPPPEQYVPYLPDPPKPKAAP